MKKDRTRKFLNETIGTKKIEGEELASQKISKAQLGWSWLFVTRNRWLFFVLSLVIACFFSSFNPFLKIDESIDSFAVEGDPDTQFYREFQDVFGEDEFFVISFEAPDLFTSENLAFLDKLTEELENVEEIGEATSLTNVDDIYGEEDYFEVRKFIEDIPENPEELKALRKAAIENPIFLNSLISEDGKVAAIVVEPREQDAESGYKKEMVQKTRLVLSEYEKEDKYFHMAGPIVTDFTVLEYVNTDMSVLIPASFILIALTTWLFFRNLRLTMVAMINIGVCVGATRGAMGMLGMTLNSVTNIVVPLVMALSLCDTVHIFSHLKKSPALCESDPNVTLARVLERVARPCLMTTITTAIGFLSLSANRIPAVREFSWAAATGMGFEFFFSFFFLPPLLLFFKPSKIYQDFGENKNFEKALAGLGDFVKHKGRIIVLISIAVCAVSIWYSTNIKVETNRVDFFRKDSPFRMDLSYVENNLGGVNSFDVSLKTGNENAFKEPSNLEVIEKIQLFLGTMESVDKTLSFVDLLKDMNESFHNEDHAYYRIPESREMVAQYLLLYDAEDIEDFVNGAFDHARISVRISEPGSLGQKELIAKVRDFIETMDRNGLDIRITGRVVNDINIFDDLVKGQVLSLGSASLAICLVMLFLIRSWKLAILSMVPNLFPIIVNFGIMGVSGIPLDTGTALIAAVALGIAIDDTIHLLTEYQLQRLNGMSVSNSIKAATIVKGRAILSSSLILSLGFGVSVLSRFVPIVHFGILTALVMLTALIGDLVVLPAIIHLKKDEKVKIISVPGFSKNN